MREGRDQRDVAPRLQETFSAEGALEVLRLQEGLLYVYARAGDRGNASAQVLLIGFNGPFLMD